MNILKFIESFTNEGLLNSKGSRRESLAQFKNLGANAALAAMPLGIVSLVMTPQDAQAAVAANADAVTNALNLALTLEYLEAKYYNMALDMGTSLIPQSDRVVFEQIAKHENAHVQFLKSQLGNAAVAEPTFDFTAGGTFPDPFTNPVVFMALAQAFEDTGVRAYKGQAANVKSNGDVLQAALQIHSVEAMHASKIRRMRNEKGWIQNDSRGTLPEPAQPVYAGEGVTTQAGFNTANVALRNGASGAVAGSESFDEPLTTQQSTDIAGLFIMP